MKSHEESSQENPISPREHLYVNQGDEEEREDQMEDREEDEERSEVDADEMQRIARHIESAHDEGEEMLGEGLVEPEEDLEMRCVPCGEEVEESEEARKQVCRPKVRGPTETERRQHEILHLPYRNWCSICVGGVARDRPHSTKPDQEREVPEI